jgi:hypothetical protein
MDGLEDVDVVAWPGSIVASSVIALLRSARTDAYSIDDVDAQVLKAPIPVVI